VLQAGDIDKANVELPGVVFAGKLENLGGGQTVSLDLRGDFVLGVDYQVQPGGDQ
jgi:hypothetical protein